MRNLPFLLLAPMAAFCQTPPAAPTFDVASLRVSAPNREQGPRGNPFRRDTIRVTPDSVMIRNTGLRSVIAWAYGVKDFQVTGPEWLDSDHLDIAAKPSSTASEDEMRMMMQSLLADRVKLALHRTTKEMQAYVVVIGKGGPKLVESKSEGDSDIQPDQAHMQLTILRTPLSQLTDLLYNILRTPIVDETGLKGKYDLNINVAKYVSMASDGPPDPIGLIQTALQEELGLKLESRKVSLDMLVVDHAEKTATEN